ncbi:MAG: DUF1071 domain-containing protein [Pyrinomonadaceae bacterium]|nr:DUF1071 domain-containing protein [Pyrinomonadaceae bacterium]
MNDTSVENSDQQNEKSEGNKNERKVFVAGERSINEIIADLKKPIHRSLLKTRTQGGKKIDFIEWHTAIKYLDKFAPGWNYEVRQVTNLGGRCVVTVRISIPCKEGSVWREATGQEEEELKGYGDPSSNAEAMALKRAAAKFGLALYLYDKV